MQIARSQNLQNVNINSKIKNKNINFQGLKALTCYEDIIEITGKTTKAKVFTNKINYKTFEQIKKICSHPIFENIKVRIMPDTHAGKSTVVGFTAPISQSNEIIPGLIGGDIGCGMLCTKFNIPNSDKIDFNQLDSIIKNFISNNRKNTIKNNSYLKTIQNEINTLPNVKLKKKLNETFSSFGTIGGGNHFIEIDVDKNNNHYLVIHTGSRHLGKAVHDFYQEIAEEQNPHHIKDWSYLTPEKSKEYIKAQNVAVKYSELNRQAIADEILKKMNWEKNNSFQSIHNYIGKDKIIRKGAISAQQNEKVIIPLNMKDGAIIGIGKGNSDWNYSAPHGAGREFSRSEASELITLEDFQKSMKGIFSSCITNSTISESPFAYKNSSEIIKNIKDSIDIKEIIKPIYNYKD